VAGAPLAARRGGMARRGVVVMTAHEAPIGNIIY